MSFYTGPHEKFSTSANLERNPGVVRPQESKAIPILITARMSSRRLAGKALMDIRGKPLLQRVVDQCLESRAASEIVVATSDHESDIPIVEYCARHRLACVTGPLDDLTGRLLQAAQHLSCEAIVRISGDSPLLDPRLVDFAVNAFESGSWDLVTNVAVRTFPQGQSVEVISSDTLAKLAACLTTKEHREHVTLAVYDGTVPANLMNFSPEDSEESPTIVRALLDGGTPLPKLTIDEAADVARIEQLIGYMEQRYSGRAGWVDWCSAARFSNDAAV